ncbi:Pyruvate decarboxylase [Metarhizium anisopliae]|nr:Pyruvate decarboxylase [Metarhizium anisopliae]
MSDSITLADYLFTRLRQLGVCAIHGVPGDYNLELLDHVEPAGLKWVGNTNELNAAYAADGYSRIKGIGALITTFGVGELSAVNAVAGAYTEFAPIVHIVGTPARSSQDSRLLIHHTFNDGEYRRFAKVHAHVTSAQASLRDPRTSAEQIDEVLTQCLLSSRPVYIEIPVDMVTATLSKNRLSAQIQIPEFNSHPGEEQVVAAIIERINSSQRPIILVDGESRPLGLLDELQKFVSMSNWPTWTTPFGKGLLDETMPNFYGIYRGDFDEAVVRDFIRGADLVLNFGPHHSSSNSYGYSNIPEPAVTIAFTMSGINIGSHLHRDMPVKLVLSRILDLIDFGKLDLSNAMPNLPRDYSLPVTGLVKSDKITQDKLWRVLANIIRPGDIVLGETGTAGYGVREMSLPSHTRLFTPVTWLSIGYMLPATQGAALAQRELRIADRYHGINDARTILLIGDGSFQMTAQELATILRLDLDVTILLINNDGYTIERCIHGRKQTYNDISPWQYLLAPAFFGPGKDSYTSSAKNWLELQDIVEDTTFNTRKGFKMVEIFMEREDVPQGPLLHYLDTQIGSESMTNGH